MRGDRVEIVIDAGDTTRSYEISATRAGRRVDVSIGRGVVVVAEVTRSGTPVRTARFMSSRVLALVEHPVAEAPLAQDAAAPQPGPQPPSSSRA
ncbi:hypothetical protein E1212_24085 [Jiangella ureilytica]|uniref:Uncharacterized protein n=1 Tax=Jiangella ureilytica TaxID=2530374 RepID=A0A4R4RE48_9ACTN|nr:hypothetical protein [Jiangella ureilytica]TDC47497.1 hypothetical protein E1212_24085 [Jiangella ureilytica]